MLGQNILKYIITTSEKRSYRRYYTRHSAKTKDQVADIFTKGLNYSIFVKHQEALGMTRRSMLKESHVEGSVKKQAAELSLSR